MCAGALLSRVCIELGVLTGDTVQYIVPGHGKCTRNHPLMRNRSDGHPVPPHDLGDLWWHRRGWLGDYHSLHLFAQALKVSFQVGLALHQSER